MRVTIIPDDQTIIIDGSALTFSFAADSNIHAIQWDGELGRIEYKAGDPVVFTDAAAVQQYIDAFNAEHSRRQASSPPWSPDPIKNAVRSARDECLNKLMGIAFAADKAGDAATVSACLTARTALLNITTAPGVLAATDDASLKAAFIAAYSSIVAAAPANVRNAFAEFKL